MAASHYPTRNYASANLIESAGGIVFSRSSSPHRRVCILYHRARGEYLLPKGRRDYGESRRSCALREIREEAGLRTLAILPVRLPSRATPALSAEEAAQVNAADYSDPRVADRVRVYEGSEEPFLCTVRDLNDGKDGRKEVKLIWWYVMQADADEGDGPTGEEGWDRRWVLVHEALTMLDFQDDRDIVQQAFHLVQGTES